MEPYGAVWQQGTDPSPVIKKSFQHAASQIMADAMNPGLNGGWDQDGNRRVKVLWIGEQEVLDCVAMCLTGKNDKTMRLRLKCDSLDLTNTFVVRVSCDWQRRAIGFMIYHPSFDPVPEGVPAPDMNMDVRWEWETLPEKAVLDKIMPEVNPDNYVVG